MRGSFSTVLYMDPVQYMETMKDLPSTGNIFVLSSNRSTYFEHMQDHEPLVS